MRVIFFSKKQNLTMERGQEKTVCVEGKFRVTSYITLISTAFISHLLAVLVLALVVFLLTGLGQKLLTFSYRKCGANITVHF